MTVAIAPIEHVRRKERNIYRRRRRLTYQTVHECFHLRHILRPIIDSQCVHDFGTERSQLLTRLLTALFDEAYSQSFNIVGPFTERWNPHRFETESVPHRAGHV